MKEDLTKKSNKFLRDSEINLRSEFEKTRTELLKLHDYWMSIGEEYSRVNNELNNRFGINNK